MHICKAVSIQGINGLTKSIIVISNIIKFQINLINFIYFYFPTLLLLIKYQ